MRNILHVITVILGLSLVSISHALSQSIVCNDDFEISFNSTGQFCFSDRNNITLDINIVNHSTDSLKSANFGWFVSNDNQGTGSLNEGIEPFGVKQLTMPSMSFSGEGNFTVSLWVNSSCNSVVPYGDTIDFMVTIRSPFIVNLPADTLKCKFSSVPIVAPLGLGNYSWSTGDTSVMILADVSGEYSVTVTDEFGCVADDTIDVGDYTAPPGHLVGDTVVCDGVILTADVGTDFTGFVWSDGSNSSSIQISQPGSYSVTVTDTNGCNFSDTMHVAYAQVPTPTAPSFISVCEGDTAIIGAGNNFNSYYWSTGDTTNSIPIYVSGVYMITVVGNSGCIGMDTVTVNVTPLPPIVFSDSVICNNNPYVLDVGQWFPSIQWSTGDTTPNILVSTPGLYTVSVTDLNGCHSTDTLDIVNINVSVDLGPNDTVCVGSSTALVPSGNFDSYLWSTGSTSNFVTLNSSGIYSVTVTKGVCFAIDEVSIEVENQPTADFLANVSSPVAQFTNLSSYMYDVLWDFGDNSYSSQIDPSHSYAGNGNYTVTLEVRNTCDTVYKTMEIGVFPQAISNIYVNNDLKIFPTLATNQIQFALDIENPKDIEYTVYDVVGKLLFHKVDGYFGSDYLYEINISNFASGTYYLKIESDSEPIAISPFVKK